VIPVVLLPLLLATLLQAAPPEAARQVLRQARAAQADFERTRRWLLPRTAGGVGRCDERVGGFCYWYDDAEPPPPREPGAIAAARRALLTRLSGLADSAPRDGWIPAQQVRYLVEEGHPDSALAVARACRAEAWWCAALEGFARHAARDYQDADRAFGSALAAMPEAMRCQWNDLEPLLEDDLAAEYRRLDCRARDSANAVLFWLGRPRFTERGNDLRTEHYARHTLVASLEDAITYHGTRLGDDLREMILRYGWATAWSRREAPPASAEAPSIVGHEPRPAYAFFPIRIEPDELAWPIRRARPRARYAPAWTRAIVPVPQVVLSRFERADSLVVVAAFESPRDSLFPSNPLEARLALSPGPDAEVTLVGSSAWGGRGSMVGRVAGRAALATLEVVDPGTSAVAVHRRLLSAVDGPGPRLSDLLLFEPGDPLVETVEQAGRAALPASRLPEGATVGLYWELYGVGGRDVGEVSVAVDEQGPELLTRVGRALGLGRRPPPLRLAWHGTGTWGQSVELDLRLLRPDRYRIRVAVEVAGYGRIEAERRIEITRTGVARRPHRSRPRDRSGTGAALAITSQSAAWQRVNRLVSRRGTFGTWGAFLDHGVADQPYCPEHSISSLEARQR
jgi:hypothetical protein